MNLESIREAAEKIRPYVHRTSVFTSRFFSEQTGCEVVFKAELFQKTGSFKPRGAINRLKHFTDEQKQNGIVSASAGNHAQAVAYAAAMEKIPCTVVMPVTASPIKLEATRGYGANVVLQEDLRTIFERTEEIRKERNAVLLHPFDDPYVIAGHGTVGLEIFEDVPDADTVVVGIGGGGLASGVAIALKSLKPGIRVIGVEPEGACGMTRALEQGAPVRLEKIDTIADGLAAPYAGKLNLECVQKYVDEVVLVPDSEIIRAVKLLLERAKLLVEPAGAASVAALLAGKVSGKKVVLILSGGNLDLKRLAAWL